MKNKGFTLIELLIVISILAILMAGAYLALNPAKKNREAKNSTAKSSLSQMRTQAASDYASDADYSKVCDAGEKTKDLYDNAVANAQAAGECNDAAEAWAAWVTLYNADDGTAGKTFCVDLDGNAVELDSAPASGSTKCQ